MNGDGGLMVLKTLQSQVGWLDTLDGPSRRRGRRAEVDVILESGWYSALVAHCGSIDDHTVNTCPLMGFLQFRSYFCVDRSVLSVIGKR